MHRFEKKTGLYPVFIFGRIKYYRRREEPDFFEEPEDLLLVLVLAGADLLVDEDLWTAELRGERLRVVATRLELVRFRAGDLTVDVLRLTVVEEPE